MAEPTLQEIFGANSYQDSSYLYISKTDLEAVGLIFNEENSGESLLAATIAIAQQHLTLTNQESNVDQSIVIDNGLPALISRNDSTYRQISKNITFEKLDNQTTFNPNDY
ncbi:MAG: hypothetical protein AAF378_08250 [Cyanobacteria bacterium P01_A01_bin.84]